MSDQFIGEIRIFGFNYAPTGWAVCNGATLSINQNTALFSLLGTSYGGNGTTYFQLPNLQGNAATSQGQGPGLSQYSLGEQVGAPTVTLLLNQLPNHNHVFSAAVPTEQQVTNTPTAGCTLGRTLMQSDFSTMPSDSTLSPQFIGVSGGGQPHENRQPFLAMNYCIALQGIYPPRS